jgi:hypothetical protein
MATPTAVPSESRIDRRWIWIAAAATVVFLVLAWRLREHRVDDAFISYRYARHLADGLGLVFNPGERVEGYSNFLWVLLLAGGMKCGIGPESLSAVLGIGAAVATIFVVAHAAARLRLSAAVSWLPPVLLAVNPAFVVWSTGGLETTLQIFLVTLGVCRLLRELEVGRPSVLSAVILLSAALNRPEGVLVGAVAALALLAHSWRGPESRRAWLVLTATFGVGFVAYFLWRWNYFGHLLPNTFYAKVDAGGSQIGRGFGYLNAFGSDLGYWLAFPLAGLVVVRRRELALIAAVVLAHVAFVVWVGGDGLPMHRFFVPVLGLLCLLVAWGSDEIIRLLKLAKQPRIVLVVVLIAACAWSARPNFAGVRYRYVQRDIQEVAAWSEMGKWFGQHADPSATVAIVPAGAIPWFSKLRALDLLGLNDVTIAHTPVAMGTGTAGHEKYNVAYVLERKPEFVLLGAYVLAPIPVDPRQLVDPNYRIEHELLREPAFQRQYRLRLAQTSSGYFPFFERK